MSYIVVPLNRGFNEIKPLFEICLKYDAAIIGGYARYCASPKNKPIPFSDVDVYFEKETSFDLMKKEIEDIHEMKVDKENDVSVLYKVPKSIDHIFRYCPPIQLIKPRNEEKLVTVGNVDTILDNFDFTITKACVVSPDGVLVHEKFIEHELSNNLIIENIHCPVSTLFRIIKYIRKGYFITPLETIKLFTDWQNRTQEYRDKLLSFLLDVEKHKETGEDILSQEQIMEMEKLMMLD